MGFRAFSLLLWECLLHTVGEVCVVSPIRKCRINFIEEHGNQHDCGQCGSSKFQAMQPYVAGLIWHRMKSPLKALLVLTFQLVDFSLRMTPKGRNQFCQLYFCSHFSALSSAVVGGPHIFSRIKVLPCLSCSPSLASGQNPPLYLVLGFVVSG